MAEPIYYDPANPKARKPEPLESPFSYRQLRRLIRENDADIKKIKDAYRKCQREFSRVNNGTSAFPDWGGNGQAAALGGALKNVRRKAKEMHRMARWWKKGRKQGQPLGNNRDRHSGWDTKQIIALCPVNAIEDLASLIDLGAD